MHQLMLITLSLAEAATSEEARQTVHSLLIEDNTFCGSGGRFGCPLCDWFVIGGRWSGFLKETLLGDAYKAAFNREFPELARDWLSPDLVNQHRERLDRFWQSQGGTGISPVTRTGYDQLGSDDDAMLVDQDHYDQFLAEFDGQSSVIGDSTRCDFSDLDHERVDETFIGRKWLVVVDYHN